MNYNTNIAQMAHKSLKTDTKIF